ncbi:hypothetical protein ACFL17_08500 [Pseudomonadota bacterium]
MKNKYVFYLVAILAIALTAAYIIAAWHLSALWSTLVPNQTEAPRLAACFIKPLPLSIEFGMLHWQLAAIFSLIINSIWGIGRYKRSTTIDAITLPFLIHVGWLLLFLMVHISGLLTSFITVVYTLK